MNAETNPCGGEHAPGDYCTLRQPVRGLTSKRIVKNLVRISFLYLKHGRPRLLEQISELSEELKFRNYLVKQINQGTPEHYIFGSAEVYEIEVEGGGMPTDGIAREW